MGLKPAANWVVCYDIADKKRLGRVFRLLKKNGIPIQYSIFLVCANNADMAALFKQISALIDPRADDVRSYRLTDLHHMVLLGHSLTPDGVLIGCGIAALAD